MAYPIFRKQWILRWPQTRHSSTAILFSPIKNLPLIIITNRKVAKTGLDFRHVRNNHEIRSDPKWRLRKWGDRNWWIDVVVEVWKHGVGVEYYVWGFFFIELGGVIKALRDWSSHWWWARRRRRRMNEGLLVKRNDENGGGNYLFIAALACNKWGGALCLVLI